VGRILVSILAWMLGTGFVWGAEAPAGWKVIKDKDGACRLAVPPEWTVNSQLPNLAISPNHSDVSVSSRPGKSVNPLTDVVQKALGVDRMLENSERRVFWAAKPVSSPAAGGPVTTYHVIVPGKGGACEARIALTSGSEALAKKIAATVASAR
jgi:hypothetical protein